MNRFDGVIFDLFDTLINFNHARYTQEHQETATRLGVDFALFQQAWAKTQLAAFSGIFETMQERSKAVWEYLGSSNQFSPDDIEGQERLTLKKSCSVFPGVSALLMTLIKQQRVLGLITNASCSAPVILELTGIHGYFKECLYSFIEKIKKPDTQIYLIACDRLGISPQRAIYVSDGDKGELQGAVSAGLNAVKFDPSAMCPDIHLPPGALVCNDVTSLKNYLLS